MKFTGTDYQAWPSLRFSWEGARLVLSAPFPQVLTLRQKVSGLSLSKLEDVLQTLETLTSNNVPEGFFTSATLGPETCLFIPGGYICIEQAINHSTTAGLRMPLFIPGAVDDMKGLLDFLMSSGSDAVGKVQKYIQLAGKATSSAQPPGVFSLGSLREPLGLGPALPAAARSTSSLALATRVSADSDIVASSVADSSAITPVPIKDAESNDNAEIDVPKKGDESNAGIDVPKNGEDDPKNHDAGQADPKKRRSNAGDPNLDEPDTKKGKGQEAAKAFAAAMKAKASYSAALTVGTSLVKVIDNTPDWEWARSPAIKGRLESSLEA